MDLRQRVLECLQEYAGDDEPPLEQLVERLMVALVQKSQEIKQLEAEKAAGWGQLRKDHEYLQSERSRLRTDPTYFLGAEYYFRRDVDHFVVQIQGGQVSLMQQEAGGRMWMMERLSPEDFHKRTRK